MNIFLADGRTYPGSRADFFIQAIRIVTYVVIQAPPLDLEQELVPTDNYVTRSVAELNATGHIDARLLINNRGAKIRYKVSMTRAENLSDAFSRALKLYR